MSGYLRCYKALGTPLPPGTPTAMFPTATGVTVIDGFDRPEDAAATWASTVTRKVLLDQVTGFVLKTATPSDLAAAPSVPWATAAAPGTIQKMVPIDIVHPSYTGAPTGTYYDAIVPLTTDNEADAEYLYLDIVCDGTPQVTVGDCTINLEYHGTAPTIAALPLMMGFSNFGMILGYSGQWSPHEADGIYPMQMLVDHRIQPFNGQLYSWDGTATDDWHTNNLRFSTHYMMVAFGSYALTDPMLSNAVATMTAHGVPAGAWTYNVDEPQGADFAAIEVGLAAQKSAAPSIRTMVTTEYSALMPSVDIWAPVLDYLGTPGHAAVSAYAGKTLWTYISCMSNGCGDNRAYTVDPPSYTQYVPDGCPDIVIDRAAAEAFGFYLLGFKHGVEALLYYNSIENWTLWARGIGYGGPIDVWTDQYNFGCNGDGTLLYPGGAQPGSPVGQTFRPYPSIRLKLLREASYMVDALTQVTDQTWAQARVDLLARTSLDWDRDMAAIESLRDAALDRLTPKTDAFAGTNGTLLSAHSANWANCGTLLVSRFQIHTNAANPNVWDAAGARNTASTSDSSQITIAGTASHDRDDTRANVRSSATSQGYGASFTVDSPHTSWNDIALFKDGEYLHEFELSEDWAYADLHTIRLEARDLGTTVVLEVWVDGVSIGTFTDTSDTLPKGNPGFCYTGANDPTTVFIDDWTDS
jgi:hypothetical protein